MTTLLAAVLVALAVVVLATPTYGKRPAWKHDPEKSNEERSTGQVARSSMTQKG